MLAILVDWDTNNNTDIIVIAQNSGVALNE